MKFWEERVWKSYCRVCGCQKSREKAKTAPYRTKKYRLWCKGIKYNIDEQTFFPENRRLGKIRHIDTYIIDTCVIDIFLSNDNDNHSYLL